MAEMKAKTRNELKCIDSLLRVALDELIYLRHEKLITEVREQFSN